MCLLYVCRCVLHSDCHSFTVQPEMLTRAHIVDKYSFGLFRNGTVRTNERMNEPRPRHTYCILYIQHTYILLCMVLLVIGCCCTAHGLNYRMEKKRKNDRTNEKKNHTNQQHTKCYNSTQTSMTM